ncbi:MAG: hypothetical protein MJE68_07765 [Proteobacteria bacterium]|nr:hypothetical protein [Pseudomonadota bacterium]
MSEASAVVSRDVLDVQAEIDKESAGEAFREHRADLLTAIVDPLILANHLYSKKIMSRETLDRVMVPVSTRSEKTLILLDAIEMRIRAHPTDFVTLLTIFGRDSCLCIFAERLRHSYSKLA